MHSLKKPVPSGLKLISFISALLVILLASASFALSFDALKELASENGFKLAFAPLFPLIIDGAIVVFSLSALRFSLHQESYLYPMFLVVAATLCSIFFNVAHAMQSTLAMVMAGIPPVALFLSFEQLMRQIRSEVKKTGQLSYLQRLSDEIRRLEAKREELSSEAKVGENRAESENTAELAMLEKANTARQTKVARRRSKVSELLDIGQKATEIAQTLDVSPKTIKRDIEAIGNNQ